MNLATELVAFFFLKELNFRQSWLHGRWAKQEGHSAAESEGGLWCLVWPGEWTNFSSSCTSLSHGSYTTTPLSWARDGMLLPEWSPKASEWPWMKSCSLLCQSCFFEFTYWFSSCNSKKCFFYFPFSKETRMTVISFKKQQLPWTPNCTFYHWVTLLDHRICFTGEIKSPWISDFIKLLYIGERNSKSLNSHLSNVMW